MVRLSGGSGSRRSAGSGSGRSGARGGSSSSSFGNGKENDSSSRRGSRQSGRASSGSGSGGGSGGRPQLTKAGKSRHLLLQPSHTNSSSNNNGNINIGKLKANPKGKSKPANNNNTNTNPTATTTTTSAADVHALRRLHRHERTLDIPTTLSIVPFPSTPYVDPTVLETADATTTMNTTTTTTASGGAAVASANRSNANMVAKTPYGGKMMAGPTETPGCATTTTGGRMRRADAGHTPGGIYLPPSAPAALLPTAAHRQSSTAHPSHLNINTTATATAAADVPYWNDGVSPLAYGAEARPVRTEADQLKMEEEERRRRRERERKREDLITGVGVGVRVVEEEEEEDGANGSNGGGSGGGGGRNTGGGRKKKEKKTKGRRRGGSGGGSKKRSDAYEVNSEGLLVVKRAAASSGSGSGSSPSSKDSDANAFSSSKSSSANIVKSSSRSNNTNNKNKKKGRSGSSSKSRRPNRAIASNLRTLGKRGLKSLRRGGTRSRRAAAAAVRVVKSKMAREDDEETIQRDGTAVAAAAAAAAGGGMVETPALPVGMAHGVDDGRDVAPYSTLPPSKPSTSTNTNTNTNATPTRTTTARHPTVPLHNFRRLSMIDLRDVVPDHQVPTTVKRRVAAAKAKAVAASTVGGGAAVAAVAYDSARVGGARVVGSARKVGRSATKSMAVLRRRIVHNVNAAGYAGERRLFGDDGHEIVDVDEDEMAEDIEEEVITTDFGSPIAHTNDFERMFGPNDEDDGSVIGGEGGGIGATLNANDTFATLDRSVAAAGGKNNDFSVLWGSSEPPTTTKSSNSGESESLKGTRMIPSATNADGEDGGFFDGGEEQAAANTKAAMPRVESFTYSYSPFNDTFRAGENEKSQQAKAGSDLNLTGFLEEPFRSGDESSENDDEENDDVSPDFTPFVAKVNANGAEAVSTNDESMSIATPAVHLGRHFDTALSISGKPKGAAIGRMPSSATLSTSSSYGSGRPPMSRLSSGSGSSSSGSRVSFVGSVQSSAASQTISLMTPIDRNTVANYSATPLRTATKEDIKPLLGDLESPMSGASELLLPSPSPAHNKSAAVSLSSASQSRVSTVNTDEEDASAFIETVVSELMEENKREVHFVEDAKQSTGPPSLINNDDDDVASRSTLTQSIVSAGSKQQQKSAGYGAIVAKEEADATENEQMVVTTAGGSFPLVPSTYEFTPKDQRQPALTKEAMQNAAFLFSPNNMGRAALKRKVAEKRASRKPRSALERYTAGIRTSSEQARIGYSRDSFPSTLGDAGNASSKRSEVSPAASSERSIGTASVSRPSSEAHVSFRVSPESCVGTPALHDDDAASSRVESTPQPVVSPSESAVSLSSQPVRSMVKESAVTPWKTASPFARFSNAKQIFSGKAGSGERIESLVSSDEMDEKVVPEVSEADTPTEDTSSSADTDNVDNGVADDVPEDELTSFVTAVASEAPSPADNPSDAEKAQDPEEEFVSMVAVSAITPYKTDSPTRRFVQAQKKLQKATEEGAQPRVLKPVMTSSTSHAGRLRKNRLISSKNSRRDTAGTGVLAPHRSNLVNPLFVPPPVIDEDEVTVLSENPSIVPSVQRPEAGGDEEQSTIASVMSIALECVALSSTSAAGCIAASQFHGGSDHDDEDEDEDDFSLALKSTSSTVATVKNERRLSKENRQRSVRWSESTRNSQKKPSFFLSSSSSRSIVLADSYDEESASMVSSQYEVDKENVGATMTTPRLAQGRAGLVDPRRMPQKPGLPSASALCLSPSARTPFEQSKWRELASSSSSSSNSSKKNSSAKKLLSSGKKRLSSGKKRLSSSGKKKTVHTAGKHTPKLIKTGKQTPLKEYNWESKLF